MKLKTLRLWIILALCLGMLSFSSPAQSAPAYPGAPTAPLGPVIRTTVFHQLTNYPNESIYYNQDMPVLSHDGNRIAFINSGRATVINFDGSGLLEVDTIGDNIDISADGSKIVVASRSTLDIVNADGSGKLTLVQTDDANGVIFEICISGDGTIVYFLTRGPAFIGGTPLPRGVWAINADGSGLRQVVSADQVAAVLGLTADNISPFGSDNDSFLDTSHDGSHLVFAVYANAVNRNYMLTVHSDGSNLVHVGASNAGYMRNVGISGDGSKVAYEFQQAEGVQYFELSTFNFDGTGQTILTSSSGGVSEFFASYGGLIFTYDGTKLMDGGTGYVFNSDGSGVWELAPRIGNTNILYQGNTEMGCMSYDGTRFAWLGYLENAIHQLISAEITTSTGSAPTITNPSISPANILYDQGTPNLTLQAQVSVPAGGASTKVGGAIMIYNGIQNRFADLYMTNTGGSTYTFSGELYPPSSQPSTKGRQVVRVAADTIVDNKHHATQVEFEPFAIVDTLPANNSIAGRVTDTGAQPVLGVTVSAGAGGSAITDASGYYTITNVTDGSYTLTPSKAGYTFSPATRSISAPPNASGQDFTAAAVSTIHTTVFHQLTNYPSESLYYNQDMPVLSHDGNRIAFINSGRATVINFDGSGLLEVDTIGDNIDISADGSKIVVASRSTLDIVNADGSGKLTLVQTDDANGVIFEICISGDGTIVYFLTRGPAFIGGTPLPRGVWAINADGSGLRQVVSADQVAAVLGLTADNISPFGSDNDSFLDTSHDGSHLVFAVYANAVNRNYMLTVHSDGSNLVHVGASNAGYMRNVGISGDGSKVAYEFQQAEGVQYFELSTFNFDGTGQTILTSSSGGVSEFFASYGGLIFTYDGTKLMDGGTGYVFNSDGSGVWELAPRIGNTNILYQGNTEMGCMSYDGTRFAWLGYLENAIHQLISAEITTSTGSAPTITNPSISPANILYDQGTPNLTLQAQVSVPAGGASTKVGGAIMIYNGIQNRFADLYMTNTGGSTYTFSGELYPPSSQPSTKGRQVVRVAADTIVDNKHHATQVEFEPFAIVDTLPANNSIAGRVTDTGAQPVLGVTVSAGAGGSAITDASGYYTITNVTDGSYTLTPSKAGYTFTPTSLAATVPPNAAGKDFVAQQTGSNTVSGQVMNSSGSGLSGAVVTAESGANAVSGSNGSFTLTGLVAGTHTITVTLAGYTFAPATITVPPNVIDQTFTGYTLAPPTDLEAYAGVASISLEWTPSATPGVTGYNVYRSTSAGGPFTKITVSPITGDTWSDGDAALVKNTRYYYYLKSVYGADESAASNIASAMMGTVTLSIPDVKGAHNGSGTVPVNIDNATGMAICAMDVYINFAPATLAISEVQRTILTLNYSFAQNIVSDGVVKISLATAVCGTPLYGPGTLFNLVFSVPGAAGTVSPLTFDVASTDLYVNNDFYNATPLNLVNGSFTVQPGFVLGDLNGDGVVTTADATIALNIAVEKSPDYPPTAQQMVAGDVNGDKRINAADAALIMRIAAGLPVLPPPGVSMDPAQTLAPVDITIPSQEVARGRAFSLPVNISSAAGVSGAELVINFEPSALDLSAVRVSSLTTNFNLQWNESSPGVLRISLSPKVGYESGISSGSGALVTIDFTALDDAPLGSHSPVTLAAVRLNDTYSRNFETSALQTDITVHNGAITIKAASDWLVFLPLNLR